ncbi:MAG: DNA translocase FtsK, partial [Planctomycetota bacterium]
AGGYLGAMGRAWLATRFATAGASIVAGSVFLAGLLLATDYLLIRLAAAGAALSGAGLATAGRFGQAAAIRTAGHALAARRRTDLDDAGQQLDAGEAAEGDGAYEDGVYEDEAYDEEDLEEDAEEDPDEWDEADEDTPEDADDTSAGPTIRTPGGQVLSPAAPPKRAGDQQAAPSPEGGASAPRSAAAGGAAAAGGIGSKLAAALIKPKQEPADPAAEAAASEAAAPPPKPEKPKSEREQIIEQLEAADLEHEVEDDFELPPVDLLLPSEDISYEAHEKEVRRKAKVLEKTFRDFGFNVKVVEVETGPVIAQYEVELEAGLRLSKITGLADDLAIALRAPSVRIVAPIPGKNTVGIEVPNENRQIVRLREVIEETDGRARRMKIPIFLGKDVAGNPMIVDLAALPHLLIAGRTGTGKSVCLNSIIVSILMSRGPDEVRMLMIDPKMVELSGYRKLPHLMHPVVTDMKKAEAILAWGVDKMEERYQLLAKAGVRHVSVYNQLSEEELRERIESSEGHRLDEAEWSLVPKQLPFIVIVADEMADLMMTAGKDVEQHIIRLAQKSRAVGIHLILATQKPT